VFKIFVLLSCFTIYYKNQSKEIFIIVINKMTKPDKYQKTKFSRDKKEASSEEDIIRNNAKLEQQKEKRLEEREKNKNKADSKDHDNDNDK
jgi:hypothetical protein